MLKKVNFTFFLSKAEYYEIIWIYSVNYGSFFTESYSIMSFNYALLFFFISRVVGPFLRGPSSRSTSRFAHCFRETAEYRAMQNGPCNPLTRLLPRDAHEALRCSFKEQIDVCEGLDSVRKTRQAIHGRPSQACV